MKKILYIAIMFLGLSILFSACATRKYGCRNNMMAKKDPMKHKQVDKNNI